eukprot:403358596
MELFVSSNTSESKLSLTVELFSNYLRATQRKMVNMTPLTKLTQQSLKINDLPLLIKSTSAGPGLEEHPVQTANPASIMLEIARSVYLEEVIFGKPDSTTRLEILSMIELATRMSPEDLIKHLNSHLELRMFLVGHSITAADITTLAHIIEHFNSISDYDKIQVPHAFRWIDHVQHLPGMFEQVQQRNLLVGFPDEKNAEAPSKSQLKKLAKIQYAKEKKGGAPVGKEEVKHQGKPKEAVDSTLSTQVSQNEEQKKPQQEKKPKQQQQQNQNKKAPAKKAPEEQIPDLSQMDIRVGKIVEVWKNPNSEKLYNEKIDIGNGEIRCIASGLQKLVKIEDMQDSLCVVLCNLKPKKLADYMSHGMVLCAETPERDVAELVQPPEGSQPGDLITFAGYERRPPDALNPKKNPWDNVAPKLNIDANGIAKYDDIPFNVEGKGVCTAKSIRNGGIH